MSYQPVGRVCKFRSSSRHRLVFSLFACTWLLTGIVAAQTAAPDVELQGILAREKIERDDDVTLYLFVSNKSNLPIVLNRVTVLSEPTVEKERNFLLPIQLPPFGTTQGKIILRSMSNAKFGAHKVVVTVDYLWPSDKQSMVTAKTIALPLEVTRRFEEEAKGFPGGTAAFLYLLLPVLPAFLSYQIVEQLKNKEKLKMPEFETKHIAPAFLVAIGVSFLMVVFSNSDAGINYSNPIVFIEVLFASLIAGAAFSGLRWLWHLIQMRRWGFSQDDDGATYLRKALLGPRAPRSFEWVTGTIQGETWQGFRLKQPNGDLVLGSQVMVNPIDKAEAAFRDNELRDPKLLVRLAKEKQITVELKDSVKRASSGEEQGEPKFVVVDGLELFQQSATTTKQLVTGTT